MPCPLNNCIDKTMWNSPAVIVFPAMIHGEIPTQIAAQWSQPTQIDTIGVVGGVI